ncbi:hypothetical protein [Microbacterium sp. 77mftsu3.1]|uniref:hypothetical protein n=1 Tax=Microbacterium sp. 77mftsu3.1 TaxID=1761802 RepID=UPI00037E3BEE|nr:hypothetical protein [Microbacterium sp. 77mftsu3.1]SDH54030.1 hypothetical protein SAMN04488590_3519 [Microbacterium sp. 77mftsu3.1]
MSTSLDDAIALVRQRAVAWLFAHLPDDVEYVSVEAFGGQIEPIVFSDASGRQLDPSWDDDAFGPLNEVAGAGYRALPGLSVRAATLPERVRIAHDAPYSDGPILILQRPA